MVRHAVRDDYKQNAEREMTFSFGILLIVTGLNTFYPAPFFNLTSIFQSIQ